MKDLKDMGLNRLGRSVVFQGICTFLIFQGGCVAVPIDPSLECSGEEFESRAEDLAESGDERAVIELARRCAELGFADSQFVLGTLYIADADAVGGYRLFEDSDLEQKGLRWIRKSAYQGYEHAMEFLADAYKYGWFDLAKDERAEACWRKAIENKELIERCIELSN
jgi:TPR repeat protein